MRLLQANNLTAGYGETKILKQVSIRLNRGEIVSVIGPNGAGKSTLLKAIFGILKPMGGTIELNGKDITGMRPDRIVLEGIGYVPQVDNVFPSLTIQENLEMGAYTRSDDYTDTMEEMFTLFPVLQERPDTPVHHLSGGQRQMVAMARALMLTPKVLLLDEPSAGLAQILVGNIFEKITEINQSGVAIILIEQNAIEALKISHRGFILAGGENRIEDTAKNILANKEIGSLYLGEEG